MDIVEMVCYFWRWKDVVSILSIGEVVTWQICASFCQHIKSSQRTSAGSLPWDDDLIVYPIKFHVLNSKSLIHAFGQKPFPETSQSGGVKQANFDSLMAKVFHEWCNEVSCWRAGTSSGSSQCVCKNGNLQIWTSLQSLPNCPYLKNLLANAWKVSALIRTSSCSVFPMYSVDIKIRSFAHAIFAVR